jgi:hypothetical protein
MLEEVTQHSIMSRLCLSRHDYACDVAASSALVCDQPRLGSNGSDRDDLPHRAVASRTRNAALSLEKVRHKPPVRADVLFCSTTRRVRQRFLFTAGNFRPTALPSCPSGPIWTAIDLTQRRCVSWALHSRRHSKPCVAGECLIRPARRSRKLSSNSRKAANGTRSAYAMRRSRRARGRLSASPLLFRLPTHRLARRILHLEPVR